MKQLFGKTTGFTLMELMAVVIIVAILSAMSAGSFKQAIERSHFAEGLQAGSAISEAVARFHYDNLGKHNNTQPKMSELDIELSKWGNCHSSSDYCKKTRYFEVVIGTDGVVQVHRAKGGNRVDYSIVFYPEFGANKSLEECIYSSNAGKTLCVSMGYTSCNTDSSTCSKSYGGMYGYGI